MRGRASIQFDKVDEHQTVRRLAIFLASANTTVSLKQQEIARFSDQHGVNLEWLLEGKGRIFRNDPIALNPNTTGSEFTAVVRTLPADD